MLKNLITIVGRPNVGKSTLFNKIANDRIAITEDTPGITRDRLYTRAEWLGKEFYLVDTGGLDPKSDDAFMADILEQAEVAIKSSDVIIFMVDGKTGITSTDEIIADMLRKISVNVVVAVNKSDAKDARDNFYDFYTLGFEDVFPIAAEHGQGVGDVLDACFKYFTNLDIAEENDDEISVAFIGKPNVGKSSLVNRILGEKRSIVTNIPGTTRDSIDSFIKIKDHEFRLVDTAGLRKKSKIDDIVERYSVLRTLSAIDDAKVCVLMIDANEGVTEQDTKVIGYAFEKNKALIIAVNKWDSIEKDTFTQKKYIEDIRIKLGYVDFAPIIFISAKTGQRVDNLIDKIIEVHENYYARVSTGVLNDVLSQAILRNNPPQDKGKRLKIYYASQVSVAPPTFVLHVNDVNLTHFSYTRYLENNLRNTFRFEGVPLIFLYRNRSEK